MADLLLANSGNELRVALAIHFCRVGKLRDRERRAVEAVGQLLAEQGQLMGELTGQIESQIRQLMVREVLLGPNGDVLTQLRDRLLGCAGVVDGLLGDARKAIEKSQRAVEDSANALHGLHDQQEMAFRALIEKHQAAQGQDRSRLEKLRNDLLAKRHSRQELEARLKRMTQDRQRLLTELSELHNSRFAIRQELAQRITKMLAPTIRVSVVEAGDTDVYRELLERVLRGGRIRHGVVAQKLAHALWPAKLAAAVRGSDVRMLMDEAELNAEQTQRVIEVLSDPRMLLELESVELEDVARVELRDGREYKDTQSLSTGQKCTAILPILLLDSENPLLVDQPEDNLDNSYIYACVVERIRQIKHRRQLVFVTHNPNIPVLGEADQVVVLEADGTTARKANAGDVDHCKTEIVTLLEGGAEAFMERSKRYDYQ